ncbi:MAG: hypothetical protein ABL883_12615 [Terricaulis sp.]
MRKFVALLIILSLAACSPAIVDSQRPSPAFEQVRSQFEREILAIEGNYSDGAELGAAAAPIAARIYGADWDLVRAEALRTFANLPEIDLTRYTGQPPAEPGFDATNIRAELQQMLNPGGMAAMRFYDANVAAFQAGSMAALPFADGNSSSMIGVKMALVGPRAYRGRWGGRDVLVSRYFRRLVIVPYSITPEGMYMPDFQHLTVFRLLP